MLTHLEALGLPEKVEKANKDLMRQTLWRWWNEVQDNSLTSYKGCIAPIKVERALNGTEKSYLWLADTKSGVVPVAG